MGLTESFDDQKAMERKENKEEMKEFLEKEWGRLLEIAKTGDLSKASEIQEQLLSPAKLKLDFVEKMAKVIISTSNFVEYDQDILRDFSQADWEDLRRRVLRYYVLN